MRELPPATTRLEPSAMPCEEPEDVTDGDSSASSFASLDGLEHAVVKSSSSSMVMSKDARVKDEQDNNHAVKHEEWERMQLSNDELGREVADLKSALVARDMEIASLRERCAMLLNSVEQQDEVIAKIYAEATEPIGIPVVNASTKLTNDARTKKLSAVAPKSAPIPLKTKPYSSVKMYPGEIVRLDLARDVVGEPPFSFTGFEVSREEPKNDSLFGRKPKARPAAETREVAILNAAVERLTFKSSKSMNSPLKATKSRSLFGSPLETQSAPGSSRSFERRDSVASEEDFAKSAGFLRRPNRKLSGRLSVIDFGLLGDSDDDLNDDDCESVDNNQHENDSAMGTDDRQSGGLNSSRRLHGGSQRNLFAEIDAVNEKNANRKRTESSSAVDTRENEETELTYAEFLERVSLPASRDILGSIRTFVGSILGPRGDGTPPRISDHVDYEFYGHHEFRRRCEQFFERMDETLLHHPAWCHASESTLLKARDGIEKYIMDKLADIAFNQLVECQQWKQEDERLLRRMNEYSFVTPDMLDIKPCMRNEVVWSMAEDELRRINSFRSPGDKINCIVRCCSVIFSVLNLARGDSGSRPGADDFLPVFIYIVLHSKIQRLHSNCEYIAAYRNPADLMSKGGYCFVNLRSAIEFINVLDASMLSISQDEFQRLYEKHNGHPQPPVVSQWQV